jgi:sec-independent protein translocase protein TatB
MFGNFGLGEIAVLALLGLLVFGPEKLPKAAADAVRMIRQLRTMATTTVNDFKSDLSLDTMLKDPEPHNSGPKP